MVTMNPENVILQLVTALEGSGTQMRTDQWYVEIEAMAAGKLYLVEQSAQLDSQTWTPSQWTEYERDIRNAALDEIATKIALMPFGDTAASFAVWIKEQKT